MLAVLKERGRELSDEKTQITHIDNGFDFLGWNFRKYKGKLLIKPSKKSIEKVTRKATEQTAAQYRKGYEMLERCEVKVSRTVLR